MEGTSGRDGNVGPRAEPIPTGRYISKHFGWRYHTSWLPIQHVFWYGLKYFIQYTTFSSNNNFLALIIIIRRHVADLRYLSLPKSMVFGANFTLVCSFYIWKFKSIAKQNVINRITDIIRIWLCQGSGIRWRFGNVSQTRLRSRTQLPSSMSFSRRLGNTNQVHISRSHLER